MTMWVQVPPQVSLENSMRTPEEISKIRECWHNQVNQSEVSRRLNISRATIRDYYNRFSNGELLETKPVSLLDILLLDQSKQWACSLIDVDTRRHSCGKASVLRTKKDVDMFESFIGPKS